MTTYLVIFIVAFALTHVLTPLTHRLAIRVGAVDAPGLRKVHSRITPRLGGTAVFLGFWLAFFVGCMINPRFARAVPSSLWGIFLGSLLLLVIGIYDDIKGASAFIKLPFQFLSAAIAFYGGVRFASLTNLLGAFQPGEHISLDYWVSCILTILWIVGVTNAMNFIDGLDALAGGLAFIVATTLLIVAFHLQQWFHASLYVALIGATLAFGRYNKYPASIFLGDTGSTFLGYLLACVSILACHKSTALGAFLIPIVALGVPISDTFYAVLRRLALGKSIFASDRAHLHHRLLILGYTQREVVWIIYVISIGLSLGVFFLINATNEFAALVVLLMTTGGFVLSQKLGLLNFGGLRRSPDDEPSPPDEKPSDSSSDPSESSS